MDWRDQRLATYASVVLAGALAAGLAVSGSAGTDSVAPSSMALLLGLAGVPLIWLIVRKDRTIFLIALGGMLAKMLGTYARFTLTGENDSRFYHSAGTKISEILEEGIVGPSDARIDFRGSGTTNLAYAVGWIYRFTGSNIVLAYMVLSAIGFVGLLLFYRAATDAIPELDRKRYAVLLFYLPTLLFWPSSLGKDAWMVGFLGLASVGVAGVVKHRFTPGVLLALVIGTAGAGWIRPHLAALIWAALVASLAWPTGLGKSRGRQLIGVAVASVFLLIAMNQLLAYFGESRFESDDASTFSSILDLANDRTTQGGSEFTAARVTGPLSFPWGAITVLFRPFPTEASSGFQLATSLEGFALLGLAIASWSRLRSLPGLFMSSAYVRFAFVYTLGFIVAFSVIANFGLLARQRAQLWPIVLVLYAVPKISPGSKQQNAPVRPKHVEQVEATTG